MRPLNYGSSLTVRTPVDLRAAIEAAAERENASASEWVRKALATVASSPPPMAMSSTGSSHSAPAGCR